ncbi:MAG: carboxymuconolactone decarboxylase family protein [Alphaproteobacteria bacterium]
MARKPKVLEAFRALNAAIFDPNNRVPAALLALVGNVASQAAGCNYCVAHTANNAAIRGAEDKKLRLFGTMRKASYSLMRSALHFGLRKPQHLFPTWFQMMMWLTSYQILEKRGQLRSWLL